MIECQVRPILALADQPHDNIGTAHLLCRFRTDGEVVHLQVEYAPPASLRSLCQWLQQARPEDARLDLDA